MPKARQGAAQALQIDDALSKGHAAMALVRAWYEWDFTGAEAEFRRALELNAGDSAARQAYAWFLCAIGRANEAVLELQRALELDPQSLEANAQLGWALYMADKRATGYEAIAACDRNGAELLVVPLVPRLDP